MDISQDRPPRLAFWLSIAGLLPALAGLALAIHAPRAAWTGQMAVLLYATSVLAFVGGLWWGLALAGLADGQRDDRALGTISGLPKAGQTRRTFANGGARGALMLVAGVALQLGAFGLVLGAGRAGLPTALGGTAVLLLLSGMVELNLARAGVIGTGWLRLRLVLSAGLALIAVLTALA